MERHGDANASGKRWLQDGRDPAGIIPSFTDPSKEFEKLIIARRVRHGRNPVMRWMVDNAVAKTDASGNIKPDKAKAKGKIDGVSALVDALARSMKQEGSVYTPERGFLSL
jgi:phage terminase large subunit-like protein